MRNCDHCQESALHIVTTFSYDLKFFGDWEVRTKAETTQNAFCATCLIEHIGKVDVCAYHMIYRAETCGPDGAEMNGLFTESAKDSAKHRRMSPDEFMHGNS